MIFQCITLNSLEKQYILSTKVKIILSKIQGQRTFRNIDPYIGIIEINCLWKNKPLHIVLGNTNFCYQSASDIQHIVILNGPEIMQEIMETLIK